VVGQPARDVDRAARAERDALDGARQASTTTPRRASA
jgi:hypothetical protein